MSARRHFFLSLLPIPLSCFSKSLAHSFIFRSTPISCLHSAFRTLFAFAKTGGVPPLVRPIAFLYRPVRSFFFSLSCGLSLSAAFSSSIHLPIHNPVTPTFTHPSPSSFTMFPSQGSDSHTMPIHYPNAYGTLLPMRSAPRDPVMKRVLSN